MNESPTLKVLKASAGSGKTYALVRQYLLLALQTNRKNYYRHILAITFTNAAAAEMKERVLKQLRGFAGGHMHRDFDASLFSSLQTELEIAAEELQQRASEVFRHMLHNYSLISICTIDSFMHRLVRSFARDLQLSRDFEVEINAGDFIEKVVDRCLDLVGTEPQLSTYIEQFVLDNFDNETSWNVRAQLIDMADSLMLESSRGPLRANAQLTLEDFSRTRKKLLEKVNAFESKVKQLCTEALQHTTDAGLAETDFSGRFAFSFFKNNLEKELRMPNATLLKQIEKGSFATLKTPAHISAKLDEVFPVLSAAVLNLAELISGNERRQYEMCRMLLNGIYAVGLLNELQHIAVQLREEENLLLIADFQKLVSEIVEDNPAPFIYERLGERYHHTLFDEFQDTSEVQWTNFLPLIENSLSKGKFNMLVGDGKQAIYRWRNGHVAQFVNLPEIKTDRSRTALQPLMRSAFVEERLSENFRSGIVIVQFNNSLYSLLKDNLRIHQSVYHETFQIPRKKWKGMVRIDNVYGPHAKERLPFTLQKIHQSIVSSQEDGFEPGAIAVLVRNRKQGSEIAAHLVGLGMRVQTEESFLLKNSPAVNAVISFMRIMHDKSDYASAVMMVNSLAKIFRQHMSIGKCMAEFAHGRGENFHFETGKFLDDHFNAARFDSTQIESLYDLAVKVIAAFNLAPDSYLEFLLQHIYEQGTVRNLRLAQFLDWWNDNSHRLFTVAAADPQSVKIMTIHKAKGLQFPVVVYPMSIPKPHSKMMWVDAAEVSDVLKFGYVKYTSKGDNSLAFREFETEYRLSELDDLNLQYVATTRPEKRLYIVHEKVSADSTDELDNALIQIYEDYNPGGESWQTGLNEKNETGHGSNQPVYFVEPKFSGRIPRVRYVPSPGDDSLLLAQRHFGLVFHEAMAKIISTDDLQFALKYVSARHNYLTQAETDQLSEAIEHIVLHPEIVQWFQPGLRIKTEAELITDSGKTLRPDRIVVYETHVDVIDFKTGLLHEIHKNQVREYMAFVSEISGLPSHGFLIYLPGRGTGDIHSPIVERVS